jgi:hypothetical protein
MDPERDQTEDSSAEVEELAQDGAGGEPAAESSTADDDTGDDLESIVTKALGGDVDDDEGEPEGESSAPGEGETDSEAEAEGAESTKDDEPGDVSNDSLLQLIDQLKADDVPLHKIERFKEIVTQNKQLTENVEALRQYQEHVTNVAHSAHKMGIDPEDMAKFMSWPIQLAQDPEAAIGFLRDFTAKWEGSLGHRLPEDLQDKVDEGYLDEDTAKELARLRANSQLTERRLQQTEQQSQEDAEKAHRQTIAQAVDDWQSQIKQRDPDYTDAKHRLIRNELKIIVLERGLPGDQTTAVKWAKEAYDNVNESLKTMRPTPRQVKPTPGRSSGSPVHSEPKSMAEAVQRALESGR